ncbi:MAG TPA: winged helix DNA-binding protein [Allosphingosinicella sp.]|nr:winged helix DNA-binding protein [Allosphingosinicella sp.]
MATAREMTHDVLRMIEYGHEPAALVLADSEAGRERGRLMAGRAGCRVSDAIGFEGALERLDRQVAADAVLVAISSDHGPELDRLLERLAAAAQAGSYRSIVVTPPELTDIVFARSFHPDVIQLCDPSDLELVAAIAAASVRQPARLNDIGKGRGATRLQQLSEEVSRIASLLASLSQEEALGEAPAADAEEEESELSSSIIRAMIRARRLREQYFPADLFADPAWDMLLDLMAARLDRQRVAVSSLCIAAAVPPTTALRWIKTLTEHGVFVRTADPQDGRRVFIELSDKAAAQLAAYLKAAQRLSPLTI